MTWMNWFEAWRTADRMANEAMRAAQRKSMLARDRLGDPPSAAETQELKRLREVADALFQQATAAMRIRTGRPWTSRRLGYDEMWSLVFNAGSRTHVGLQPPAAATADGVRGLRRDI